VLWIGSDDSSRVYKCNLDGSVIESFSISANGSSLNKLEGIAIDHENQLLYAVTDEGQELLVYEITDPTLSIPNELAQNNTVILYPNPINNSQELTVKVTNYKQDLYTVSIYNALGQLKSDYTANNDAIKISIKDLPAGIYYVTLKFENTTVVKKFIKKNI
jgi:6-phosphogluconolactonase (cycloisomerase 2 family)